MNELLLIKEFLLYNINTLQVFKDTEFYIEVMEIELKIA